MKETYCFNSGLYSGKAIVFFCANVSRQKNKFVCGYYNPKLGNLIAMTHAQLLLGIEAKVLKNTCFYDLEVNLTAHIHDQKLVIFLLFFIIIII